MRVVDSRIVKFKISDDVALLTAGQVRVRYGVSDSWIDRHVADETFPKPIYLPNSTQRRWRRSDLEKWERALASKSRAS